MKDNFLKYFPLIKADEATHTVYGIATAESPDKAGEICDYEATVPLYQDWSNEAMSSTMAAGQEVSLGNIRLQHTLEIAGKVTKLDFDAEKKHILIETKPVSDYIWELVSKGYVRGFSQGGRYLWRKCNDCGTAIPLDDGNVCSKCDKPVYVRYAARPSEVSYVDNPALKVATFSFVKSDGGIELRKFSEGGLMDVEGVKSLASKLDSVASDVQALKKAAEGKTKRIAGEDLSSSAFAYVGDKEKTETWKFPLHFSTPEKSKRHVQNALARWSQAKDIPADKKAGVRSKIVAAAKKYGIQVEEEEKADKAEIAQIEKMLGKHLTDQGLTKSMGSIADLTSIIQQTRWVMMDARWEAEYEPDDRDEAVAVELEACILHLVEILKEVVDEETSELTARKAEEGVSMANDNLQKKAAGLGGHFRKAAKAYGEMADCQTMKADAHKAYMEAMDGCNKGDNPDLEKAYKAFMKSQRKGSEDMAKSYKAMADHCNKMADEVEEAAKSEDSDELKKAEELRKAEEAKAAQAKADADAAKAAATTLQPGTLVNFEEVIQKAFTTALAAQPKALTLEEVTKAVGDLVDSKLEKAIVPAPAGFSLVPRPGGDNNVSKSTSTEDLGI